MSAKILYTMSDERQNLKKQIGCMNGLLQFFDPHHYINDRVITTPRRIPSDEIKQRGRRVNNGSKRSKENNRNAIKEIQVNPTESSRLSISSCGSTTVSTEFDWNVKSERSPFPETIDKERHSWDNRANKPHSSPRQPRSPAKTNHYFHKRHTSTEMSAASASPIKTASREVLKYELAYMDSPRLQQKFRPDSPGHASLNESFRSTSSIRSAPAVTPKNKDPVRLSYDGRDTRDGYNSSLKLRDLPRLSLDSKQRTIEGSAPSQEPASYRAPSNIVAKLMGLEALPDYIPPKSQIEQDVSSNFASPGSFSRSSRTIDETRVDRVLHSPRRSNKFRSEQTASVNQEAHLELKNHPATVYGAIEKRLADLDFQRSGKDLRALKQILESMHREKNKQENRRENQFSHGTFQMSNCSSADTSQKQGPKKATPPTSKGLRSVKDVTSTREIKPTKLVKGSREEPARAVHDLPQTSLQQIRIVQAVHGTKDLVQKKTAKDLKGTHHIINKYSGITTPRSIRTSKSSETTKANVTSSVRMSDRIPPATTSGSRVKQSQKITGFLSQNQKLPRNSSPLQDINDQSSEFSKYSTCQNQQGNTKSSFHCNNSMNSNICIIIKNADESCMTDVQPVRDNKNTHGIQDDTAFGELTITVREQPSPVSVLDASFYEDESPSPVKKRPTTFVDYESDATYNEADWKGSDPTYSPHSMRPGFSSESGNQKLENIIVSAPAIWKLNSYQRGNISNDPPLYKDVDWENSYVSEILLASGFLDHLNYTRGDHLIYQSQEAINPNLFFVLEKSKGRSFVSDKRSNSKSNRVTTYEKYRRRLLFDAVNEILSQKLSRPRPNLKKQSRLETSCPQLLQEIIQEIDQLQAINFPQSLDEEDDFLTTIIGKDLTHRSANWTDVSSEIPTLILDIERLIFKDLIVELVHD